MALPIIRCDRWKLEASAEQRKWIKATTELYSGLAEALMGVVNTHWPEVANADSRCSSVERLIHETAANPTPTYDYFGKAFYKFPSYLRRAAIEFAIGQVSSYQTRYRDWQGGTRKRRDAKPPRLVAPKHIPLSLYHGACIQYDDDYTVAWIKLFNGSDWIWSEFRILTKGKRHLPDRSFKQYSPSLSIKPKGVFLAVPFGIKPEKKTGSAVCGVDLGINTTAVASIVQSDGTVTARQFFHRGADIDRRDKLAKRISKKASLTMGKGDGKKNKLHRGFCAGLYRKARHISKNMAHHVSKGIVDFALENGAGVIAVENLKYWRPTASKRSGLKAKFHGWYHRMLAELVTAKAQEVGVRIVSVYARGTSSQAFDGSGAVKRAKDNATQATFPSGKQYNADLNASYNIGARGQQSKIKPVHRKNNGLSSGKSSGSKQRIPVSLFHLWDKDAPHDCGAAA
jgi:IS605 OrfB family transposase